MKEIARQSKWVDVSQNTLAGSDGVSVEQLRDLIDCLSGSTLVSMLHNSDEDYTTVYTGFWRMETNAEYEERLRIIEERERNVTSAILVPADEYAILKEKAEKYDQLCK